MWCSQEFRGECGGTLIETSSLVGLIGVLCIVAVIGFGDSVGEFYCSLASNRPNPEGGERAGLYIYEEEYAWDPGTHTCARIETGLNPFGGGNAT